MSHRTHFHRTGDGAPRRAGRVARLFASTACLWLAAPPVHAATTASAGTETAAVEKPKAGTKGAVGAKAPAAPAPRFDIDDFAVRGAEKMPQVDLEEAIYPYLGPDKGADDVEKARAALEKAYHDRGYQTVSVAVPPQDVRSHVIVLQVTELKVGRLRVKNAKYFDVDRIKAKAPSLREGTLPNFNAVTQDIVSLNLWPDRRVTPSLRAGVTPGTVDVDLNVEDKLPLHASLEVNNRQSPNTTALRATGTIHYDNLWQLGHSLSFTYLTAPQNIKDAQVISASYLARLPNVDWVNILVYGVTSDSSVATVGGVNVIGPGQNVGTRAVFTLPALDKLYHTISIGPDYKHFDQTVQLGTDAFSSPVTYYPVVASYSATFQDEKFTTQLTGGVTSNLRPLSSDWSAFDAKRAYASPSFTHFNLDVAHTQELPKGFELYGHAVAQKADGPLVSSEQFSAGGLDSVRGYLESEVLGDDGMSGTVELRSPDLAGLIHSHAKDADRGLPQVTALHEWRMFAFADAARVRLLQPLPDQASRFDLASYGVGTRVKLLDNFNGMVVCAVPIFSQAYSKAGDPRFQFRVWGEF